MFRQPLQLVRAIRPAPQIDRGGRADGLIRRPSAPVRPGRSPKTPWTRAFSFLPIGDIRVSRISSIAMRVRARRIAVSGLMKSLLVSLALLAIAIFALAVEHLTATRRQVILLKLDDLIAEPSGSAPVSARWLRVAGYLAANRIKGSFGLICESLEKDNAGYFRWLKDIERGGVIELWLHGYHLKEADEPGEFDHGTSGEQRAILEKSERLAKEKLGFTLPAFGPHWSTTTEATDEALEAVAEIKIWLYGPFRPKHFARLSLPRVMTLENPIFVPDASKFIETYEKVAAPREFLVLQGHPDQWDDTRWASFLQIIDFLKSRQVVFMTPSEYMQKSQGLGSAGSFP